MTVWMHQHLDLLPMQLSEGVVYQYLSWLRDTGAAPTFADATVKSIWFMRATAGISGFCPKSFTSRISDVCGDMYMRKRILKQAPPFPASVVRAPEGYALTCNIESCSMFTNFILFCIYASCRIGDATQIRSVEFSRHQDVFLVEAATSDAKSTRAQWSVVGCSCHLRRLVGGFTQIPGASNGGCNWTPWNMRQSCQFFEKFQVSF